MGKSGSATPASLRCLELLSPSGILGTWPTLATWSSEYAECGLTGVSRIQLRIILDSGKTREHNNVVAPRK